MALGTNRTRNWCKDEQQCALSLVLLRGRVVYKVRPEGPKFDLYLYLAPSNDQITLGFESVARLENIRRGCWKAFSILDDRELAAGISRRDVVRATIQAVWQ